MVVSRFQKGNQSAASNDRGQQQVAPEQGATNINLPDLSQAQQGNQLEQSQPQTQSQYTFGQNAETVAPVTMPSALLESPQPTMAVQSQVTPDMASTSSPSSAVLGDLMPQVDSGQTGLLGATQIADEVAPAEMQGSNELDNLIYPQQQESTEQQVQDIVSAEQEALPSPITSMSQKTPPPPVLDNVSTNENILSDPEPIRISNTGSRYNLDKSRVISEEQAKRKVTARNTGKRAGMGNGVLGTLTGSSRIPLREVSFGSQEMLAAVAQPESMLRDIIMQYAPDAQIDQMIADPAYGWQILDQVFNGNDIELLAAKHPTPSEADSHLRVVRIHQGRDAVIHPLAAKMMNADFDGDGITVSFDLNETIGTKTAMDFLVGTDNEVKIDGDFFNFVQWGSVDQIADVMRQAFDQRGFSEMSIQGLASAIHDAQTNGNFGSLARWTRKFGEDYGQGNKQLSDRFTDSALSTVYQYNSEILKAEIALNFDNNNYVMPMVSDVQEVNRPPEWNFDLNDGTMPANMHDLLVELNAPVGQAMRNGKNAGAQFRAVSALGKRIKADRRLPVGQDNWKSDDTWTNEAEELMAKAMSAQVGMGESNFGASSYMRTSVIREVGAPRMYESIKDFADAFSRSYNFYATALNQAETTTYSDWSVKAGKQWTTVSNVKDATQIAVAFKKVYGEYTMASMFGDEAPAGLGDLSVNEFINQSRGRRLVLDFEKGEISLLSSTQGFLNDLTNTRTSSIDYFNDLFNTALNKNAGKFAKALKESKHNRNYVVELNALSEALYLLGPDTFSALGLDSASNFRNHPIGRRMIAAKNTDALGGVVYEAVGRYRTMDLQEARDAYRRADDAFGKEVAMARIEAELDSLASISDTWSALVNDFRNGGNAFNEILFNERLTKSEKDRKLNDLQKEIIGYRFQQVDEIAYELMSNPSGLYAGTEQLTDFGMNDIMDSVKASSDKIDSYSKFNYEQMIEQVNTAREKISTSELDQFLQNISSGRQSLFSVDRASYIDAVNITLERSFASTEKAQQEDAVDALYVAASTLKNGGVWSDVAIADDFFLGKMSIDRFLGWQLGISKILSDPSYSIEVYDENGSSIINRESLVGDNSTDSLWDYWLANPRMAMAMRSSTVIGSSDGSNFVNSTNTLTGTILSSVKADPNQVANDRVFTELVDRPGFAAMLVMMSPTSGINMRQLRTPSIKRIDTLIEGIRKLSESTGHIPTEVRKMVEEMAGDVVITELVTDAVGNIDEVDVKEQLIASISSNLANYAAEVRQMGLPPVEGDGTLNFRFDDMSTNSRYFDVIQTLSGAKTSTSTGVNGAESKRNAILAFVAQHTPEPCAAPEPSPISVDEFRSNWTDYERRRTTQGVYVTEQTVEEIIETHEVIAIEAPEECLNEDGCACERHKMADPSTNFDAENQSSPLARYMLDKRSLGTEGNNLKVKKYGDDGTDSISKHNVFDTNPAEVKAQVAGVLRTQGKPAAIRRLAELLHAENERIQYDSLTVDDFVNIAQLMIREDTEGGIDILSVEQINAIVKGAVSDVYNQRRESLTQDDIVQIGLDALRNYDTTAQVDIDAIATSVKVSRQNRLHSRIENQRQSSVERNLQLTEQLQREVGEVYTAADVKRISESLTKAWTGRIPNGYTMVGYISSGVSEYYNVVGPRNMWVVDQSALKADIILALNEAETAGIAVYIPVLTDKIRESLRETGYIKQIHELNQGEYMLPFFDTRLNGPNTMGQEGAFNTGVYRINPDNVSRIAEDTYNVYQLGDAEFLVSESFTDRVHPTETGQYELNLRDAFAVLTDAHPGTELNVTLASKVDIEAYIVNDGGTVPIDIGQLTPEGDRAYDKVDAAIQGYIERFDETDENGWLPDGKPEEVIGWLVGECGGDIAWHPVRTYDIREGKRSPDTFTIDAYAFDTQIDDLSRGRFFIQWTHEGSLLGQTFKILEGTFPTNKMIARQQAMPTMQLKSGNNLDGVVASASTSTRRLTQQVQQSMYTLMAEARLTGNGYNFADVEGTFPARQDIKEGLQAGTLRLGDWSAELALGNIEFFPASHPNKSLMDAFANDIARKAIRVGVNPSDVFASHYNGVPTNHWFRFNTVFSNSRQFTDNLMQFFHFMDKNLCPDGLDGDYSKTLFNNKLQMLVPYNVNGQQGYVWSYVYTGLHFLDSHYAGFSNAKAKSAHKSISIDNTLLYGGRELNPDKLEDYLGWALADVPRSLSDTWLVSEDEE